MKKCVFCLIAGLFFLMIIASVVAAGDSMVIYYKNGKKQTVDSETIERIEFQQKAATSDSYGSSGAAIGNFSGRTVHIVSKNSGKCLDVAGVDKNNGANVQQWDCHSGDNQRWQLR